MTSTAARAPIPARDPEPTETSSPSATPESLRPQEPRRPGPGFAGRSLSWRALRSAGLRRSGQLALGRSGRHRPLGADLVRGELVDDRAGVAAGLFRRQVSFVDDTDADPGAGQGVADGVAEAARPEHETGAGVAGGE